MNHVEKPNNFLFEQAVALSPFVLTAPECQILAFLTDAMIPKACAFGALGARFWAIKATRFDHSRRSFPVRSSY